MAILLPILQHNLHPHPFSSLCPTTYIVSVVTLMKISSSPRAEMPARRLRTLVLLAKEHGLVQFPAPTWWYTTILHSSTTGFDAPGTIHTQSAHAFKKKSKTLNLKNSFKVSSHISFLTSYVTNITPSLLLQDAFIYRSVCFSREFWGPENRSHF